VLEKTLESSLDCKEIQPVHSEGDQPFTVQLSHPYMTTGKTIALTRQTFVEFLFVPKSLHRLRDLL